MARHVFFSFHYQDVADFRANVVRNSWLLKKSDNRGVFYDKSIWEEAQLKGVNALKELIQRGLHYTSATAVLIGQETHERRWVKYEIFKSFEDGNGLLAVYVNRIKGKDGYIVPKGHDPFDRLGIRVSDDGKYLYFYELVEGKWQSFKDSPYISNKNSNTLYFDNAQHRASTWGKFFKLSDLFPTYCWENDDGYNNFSNWVEKAVKQAGR